jgi:hypothetical protein
MPRALQAVLMTAIFVLASCGGGDAGVAQGGAAPATATAASPVTAQRAAAGPLRASAPLTPAGLFDWAAQHYPQFFSGTVYEGTSDPYTYRHYADTNSFVAVSTDGDVYALIPNINNGQPMDVGPFAWFRCQITPDACPGLEPGGSLTGTIASVGDENWHPIQLVAGQPYTFDLEGADTGQGALADPFLRLLDSAGREVTSNDDGGSDAFPNAPLNSRIVCAPSGSGLYFLAASNWGGRQTGTYRLTASTTASPGVDCASLIGDVGVDWNSSFSASKLVDQSVTLSAQQAQGWSFPADSSMALEVSFAASSEASVYLTTVDDLALCIGGGTFSSRGSFTGLAAYQPFSLPSGSFGLCVRSNTDQPNPVRLDLHEQPTMVGFYFSQSRFDPVARTVLPGERFTVPATVGALYRTLIEGASTGGKIFIIPLSEEQNFLNGPQFNYFTDLTTACAPAGVSVPQLCELTGINQYVIAYQNDTTTAQSVVLVGRDYVPN